MNDSAFWYQGKAINAMLITNTFYWVWGLHYGLRYLFLIKFSWSSEYVLFNGIIGKYQEKSTIRFQTMKKRVRYGIESCRFIQIFFFVLCSRRVLGMRFISDWGKTNQATVFIFFTIKHSILSFVLLFTEYVCHN